MRRLVSLALVLFSLPAFAAEIGDPAPALKVAKWVKGGPVVLEEGKGKTVYVVEFWATWCGPCKETIPHMSQLARKYKDKGVVFAGVSNEDDKIVKTFVDEMGDKMDYAVAVDDANATNKAYMDAYQVNAIPHAFLVNKDGVVLWHGHPMDNLDEVIDSVLAGKMTVESVKKAKKAGDLMEEYFKLAKAGAETGKLKEAAKKVLDVADKDAALLNEFAWYLLTAEGIKDRDLELALSTAKSAMDLSESKDPAIMDTYSRALFMTGKVDEAIDLEKKAIALCKEGDKLKEDLQKALEEYQAKKGTK